MNSDWQNLALETFFGHWLLRAFRSTVLKLTLGLPEAYIKLTLSLLQTYLTLTLSLP